MAGDGAAGTYEVAVTKLFSSRLGGAIFGGTSASMAIRVVAAGNVMGGLQPAPRDRWLVAGAWETHEKYGRQFRADRAYLMHPSGRVLVPFLQDRILGTGHLASRLYARLGGRLAGLLAQADLTSLAGALALPGPGRSLMVAARFVHAWRSAAAEATLACWLDGHGLDGPRLATKAVSALGLSARERIVANPYLLASLAESWPRLDTFAWEMLEATGQGSPRTDQRRLVGSADHTVKELVENYGGTVLRDAEVRTGVARCLRLKPRSTAVVEAIRLAECNGSLVSLPGGKWRTPAGAALEEGLAERLAAMAGDGAGDVRAPDAATLEAMLDSGPHAVRGLGPGYRAAALRCLQESPAMLAGTGNALILRAVRFLWEALGGRFEACSPTWPGAAALSRAAGMPVRTLWEVLEALELDNADPDFPSGGGSAPDSSTLLAVDDANAIPLGLWHRLVTGLPPGCRLLLAGDPDQLPPLGPGLVFHVLAQARGAEARIPAPGRAPAPGSLAAARTATAAGLVPATRGFRGQADGAFLEPCGPGDLLATIAGIVAALGGFSTGNAVQVVAHSDGGDAGADALNAFFHAAHLEAEGIGLPSGWDDPSQEVVRGYRRRWFAVGEPVVVLRNDCRQGLFAGTMGRVASVVPGARHLVATFGGREVGFGPGTLGFLSPAWCLGGNLIQACRPERMVIALPGGPLGPDRSWIHAAVARATRQVIFVGDPAVIASGLRRSPSWHARQVGFSTLGGPC